MKHFTMHKINKYLVSLVYIGNWLLTSQSYVKSYQSRVSYGETLRLQVFVHQQCLATTCLTLHCQTRPEWMIIVCCIMQYSQSRMPRPYFITCSISAPAYTASDNVPHDNRFWPHKTAIHGTMRGNGFQLLIANTDIQLEARDLFWKNFLVAGLLAQILPTRQKQLSNLITSVALAIASQLAAIWCSYRICCQKGQYAVQF